MISSRERRLLDQLCDCRWQALRELADCAEDDGETRLAKGYRWLLDCRRWPGSCYGSRTERRALLQPAEFCWSKHYAMRMNMPPREIRIYPEDNLPVDLLDSAVAIDPSPRDGVVRHGEQLGRDLAELMRDTAAVVGGLSISAIDRQMRCVLWHLSRGPSRGRHLKGALGDAFFVSDREYWAVMARLMAAKLVRKTGRVGPYVITDLGHAALVPATTVKRKLK